MDGESFDRLTRLLGVASGRRGALGAAVGVVAALAAGGAAAKDRPGRRRGQGKSPGDARSGNPHAAQCHASGKCTKAAQCCSGYCAKKKGKKSGSCACAPAGKPCSGSGQCCTGTACVGGTCACPDGRPACKSACCAAGTRCKKGRCVADTTCTRQCAGSRPCGADGCGGSCGSCAAGETCEQGQCRSIPCETDAQACQRAGRCGDAFTDCGKQVHCACPNGHACLSGACVQCESDADACLRFGCDGGRNNCDQWVECPCPTGQTCQAGTCVVVSTCVPDCAGKQCGPNGCDGTCGDCGSGQECNQGQCVVCEDAAAACQRLGCDGGYSNCGSYFPCLCPNGEVCDTGTCVPCETDAQACQRLGCDGGTTNCGQQVECPCPTGQTCQAGTCVCVPESRADSCARAGFRCGFTTDVCGNPVTCAECPALEACVPSPDFEGPADCGGRLELVKDGGGVPLLADDRLSVYLNGELVAVSNAYNAQGDHFRIYLRAKAGDTLRIVAEEVGLFPNNQCFYGTAGFALLPYSPDGTALFESLQVLDKTGVPWQCSPNTDPLEVRGKYYDETFTVAV